MPPQLPEEPAPALLRTLLHMHTEVRAMDKLLWPVSCEHKLTVIESGINSIVGHKQLYYGGFLRRRGLSRNSLLLANAMRYLAVEDYAIDPMLFAKVLRGAILPVMASYDDYLRSGALLPQPSAAVPSNAVQHIAECVLEHIEWGDSPSRFGTAINRETIALVVEDLVAEVLPDLFDELGWHYRIFMKDSEHEPSYTQFLWEENASIFDIEIAFAEFWVDYLRSVAGRVAVETTPDYLDGLRVHFAQVLARYLRVESEK